MSSCLGLYVEDKIIKYAKVSKERDTIKVESFGMKFYDKLTEAINQIIGETYSYKTPIAINLGSETYQYFYMPNIINKKDFPKAIATEFESLCYEKGINVNALESRYALATSTEDKDKIKVIHVSTNKSEITKKMQELEGNRLVNICPLPIAITNLVDLKSKENIAIVNIEDKTTMTTIIDQKLYDIYTLETGAQEILYKINEKENSFSKAYQICKNSTIYTSAGKDLQEDENEYLEEIMPTLYNIVEEVRKILVESLNKIDKVYITGTAAVINNIDLYFQENLSDLKCEILKPYFASAQAKINIKDYIEVNSALAIAMQGLGEGLKEMNFKKPGLLDQLPDWLQLDLGSAKKANPDKTKKGDSKLSKLDFKFDLKEKLDPTEKGMLRIAGGITFAIIIYCIFSGFLTSQINTKTTETKAVIADAQVQVATISSNTQKIRNKTTEYTNLIQNLKDISEKITEKYETKNAIPNFLTQVMFSIPKGVQLTSIENTTGRHIVINAQAEKIEQLGFFKANLKTKAILLNVISESGVKQDGTVNVNIEGDLP